MNLYPNHKDFVQHLRHHEPFFFWIRENRSKLGDTIINIGLDNNVGHAPSWPWINWMLDDLQFKHVYILEIYGPNAAFHKDFFSKDSRVTVIEGDARKASTYGIEADTSFWWHGPEHIPLADLPLAFSELDKIVKKAHLWSCPWGNYYGVGDGRFDGDQHHFYPENEHFGNLGFKILNTGGPKNTGHANINSILIKE